MFWSFVLKEIENADSSPKKNFGNDFDVTSSTTETMHSSSEHTEVVTQSKVK